MKRVIFSVLFLLICSGCTDWEEKYESQKQYTDYLGRELSECQSNLSFYKNRYESTKSQLAGAQKRLNDVIAYDKSGIRGLFQQFSFGQLILFSLSCIWFIVAVAVFLWMRKFVSCTDIDNVSVNNDGGKASTDKVGASKDACSSENIVCEDPFLHTVSKVQLWEGGPYWADRNVGAEKPENYGYYFWWGDKIGYKREHDKWVASDGSVLNFDFGTSNVPTCDKSVSVLKSEGWITASWNEGVLSLRHDAAQKHWGGDWRMPTMLEFDDLNSKCDWIWTTRSGVDGYVVRGKGSFSSASIFLPCAGYGYGTSLDRAGSHGYYWSSVPDMDYYKKVSGRLGFSSSDRRTYNVVRYYGQTVRPVQAFTK